MADPKNIPFISSSRTWSARGPPFNFLITAGGSMNWAPAPACFWVTELWASFECWVSFGMMGCKWVEALEQ